MDLTTARKILGVSESASYEEVKLQYRKLARKYHPDANTGGNGREFVLLGIAFSELKKHLLGEKSSFTSISECPEDIINSFNIDDQVHVRFRDLHRDYLEFRSKITQRTTVYISDAIDNVNSSTDLRDTVKGRVARKLHEAQFEIENHMRILVERLSNSDNKDFAFNLFSDLYQARKRHWMINLYRNGTLISCLFLSLIILALRHYPNAYNDLPATIASNEMLVNLWIDASQLASLSWVIFLPLGWMLIYLFSKYMTLNPRYQFVPPQISLVEINKSIDETAKGINLDKSDNASGLALIGTIIGAFAGGPVGLLVGAGIGGTFGWLTGKNLKDMKKNAKSQVLQDFEHGMHILDDHIAAWVERNEREMVSSIRESISKNFSHLSKVLAANPSLARKLTTESRLFLEGPKNK